MRFTTTREAEQDAAAVTLPSRRFLAALEQCVEEIASAGVLLGSARTGVSRGKPTVTDGPFTETKELIAGYAPNKARPQDAAIE